MFLFWGGFPFAKEVCATTFSYFFSDLYSLPRYVLPQFGPQMHLLQVGVVLHQCVSYFALAHFWCPLTQGINRWLLRIPAHDSGVLLGLWRLLPVRVRSWQGWHTMALWDESANRMRRLCIQHHSAKSRNHPTNIISSSQTLQSCHDDSSSLTPRWGYLTCPESVAGPPWRLETATFGPFVHRHFKVAKKWNGQRIGPEFWDIAFQNAFHLIYIYM